MAIRELEITCGDEGLAIDVRRTIDIDESFQCGRVRRTARLARNFLFFPQLSITGVFSIQQAWVDFFHDPMSVCGP